MSALPQTDINTVVFMTYHSMVLSPPIEGLGFLTRSDTNRPVQLKKKARCLKFRI